MRSGARGRPSLRAAALALTLVLSGCATGPAAAPTTPPATPAPSPSPSPAPATPAARSPTTLPGWSGEDHLAAFEAYATGCTAAREAAARVQCARAMQIKQTSRPVTRAAARAFFETGFTVVAAETADGRPGLLTSYFAPEYPARTRPDAEFDAPVLAPPAGWTSGRTLPPRAVIEADPRAVSASAPLAWMRAEDLFFMQIQGSGYLTLEDGSRIRAAYAADNGQPFTGIARPMAEQGLLPRNGTSGDAIRAWLAAHRGAEARAVMALNPRYIFFKTDPDDGGDPAGAAGVPLPARRAIAVDPASWRYGDLVWISADGGNLTGARGSYQGLVVALDTGSAIRGPVRADLYMGRGEAAGAEAGSVRHPLRMWRLVPKG
ncbi:MltA domain-containing protein [Brevundimonas sp.]|uniref:MltA domain-containing protein n=1 Tax=Brevundimonas sp. TaxID=1871086 RepID=UPI002FCB44FD